jgi:hypothetical protein
MRLAESQSSVSPDSCDEFIPTKAEWVDFRTIIEADHYEDETPELPDSAWYEPDDDHPHDSFLGGVG